MQRAEPIRRDHDGVRLCDSPQKCDAPATETDAETPIDWMLCAEHHSAMMRRRDENEASWRAIVRRYAE